MANTIAKPAPELQKLDYFVGAWLTEGIGYDTRRNVYTFDAFSSLGLHQTSEGSVNGDTWTWTSRPAYGAQTVQQRMTMKILSPTSYILKFEISEDARTWKTFMEGKAVKK